MSYNFDIMPSNLQEWNELVDYYTEKSATEHAEAVAAATASAEAAFDASLPVKREELIAQAKASIASKTRDGSEGPEPLSEEEQATLLAEAELGIDAELAKEREAAITNAVSGVPAAQPRSDFEHQFACYYPQPAPEPEPEPTTEQLFAQLRSIREVKFREYDEAVSQLERRARIGENVASQLAAWDAYAIALCELPEQSGAPWDGGGSKTPWPMKP